MINLKNIPEIDMELEMVNKHIERQLAGRG